MHQGNSFDRIWEMLLRCGAHGVEQTAAGAQFICPVPKHAPLAYLHDLYRPSSQDDLVDIRELFGYVLPDEYVSFLKLHNGASLFVGAISIHGWGKVISRGLSLDERSAILLDSTHREHRLLQPDDWARGWRLVGNLVAKNRHSLALDPGGTFRLRTASGRERTWASFVQMLGDCIAAVGTCFNCEGIDEGGYARLEETFEALAAPKI